MQLEFVTGAMAGFSGCILLWQWMLGRGTRFVEVGRGLACTGSARITVLKPLKGVDPHTEESLRSWLDQDYPPDRVQILCGVADGADPVVALVNRLRAEYPGRDLRLVVCAPGQAANPKVSVLVGLEPMAAGELLVVSDADVWAPPHLLRVLCQTMQGADVGMAWCPYVIVGGRGFGVALERVGANADFWAQALMARALGRTGFALGAVMCVSRGALAAIGGFRSIGGYLADDYHLGRSVHARGFRVEVAPVVVACRMAEGGLARVWAHQLRWARTIRSVQPVSYAISILGNLTWWVVLWVLAARTWPVVCAGAGLILLRMLVARALARRVVSQVPEFWRGAMCTKERSSCGPARASGCAAERARAGAGGPEAHDWWLAPLRDIFGVVLWLGAFVGNTVEWHGQKYRITTGGRLESASGSVNRLGRAHTR